MRGMHITHRSGRARRLSWLVVAGLTTVALVAPSSVSATKPDENGDHKVTICHRTNSVTNPYVIITVDYSGADGGLVHDNGNGDHTNHLGPAFDFSADPDVAYPPPHNGDQWGDIIPPFSWPGDANHPGGSYPGLNWSEAGQIIYRNNCGQPQTTTTTSQTTTSDTTTEATTSEETTTSDTTTEATINEQTTSSDTTSSDTTTSDTTTEQTTEETTTSDTTTSATTTSQTTQTTSAEPTPTPTPTPRATPDPTPTPTPNPTPTPTPTPTPDPTDEVISVPTGEVLSEVGVPRVTLPPTDTLPQGTSTPSGDNWRLILLAMAGILAGSLVLTPSEALARRKER